MGADDPARTARLLYEVVMPAVRNSMRHAGVSYAKADDIAEGVYAGCLQAAEGSWAPTAGRKPAPAPAAPHAASEAVETHEGALIPEAILRIANKEAEIAERLGPPTNNAEILWLTYCRTLAAATAEYLEGVGP